MILLKHMKNRLLKNVNELLIVNLIQKKKGKLKNQHWDRHRVKLKNIQAMGQCLPLHQNHDVECRTSAVSGQKGQA